MRKLALIIPAFLAIGAGAYYFKIICSEVALMDMYPDHDPAIVVRVHREFVIDTLKGKYQGTELTDEKCEEIFKQRLAEYANK